MIGPPRCAQPGCDKPAYSRFGYCYEHGCLPEYRAVHRVIALTLEGVQRDAQKVAAGGPLIPNLHERLLQKALATENLTAEQALLALVYELERRLP